MIWGRADVTIIQIKYAINVMYLNHSKTIPCIPKSIENCLPQNWPLVTKSLGTYVLITVWRVKIQTSVLSTDGS